MPDGDHPHIPHQQRWNETSQDSWRREMRELINDTRTDLRERITEVKITLGDRLGPLERKIGELEAGKADKEDLSQKADKKTELIVYGLITMIVVYVVSTWLGIVVIKPASPDTAPIPLPTSATEK
jgi:hypothetical protein